MAIFLTVYIKYDVEIMTARLKGFLWTMKLGLNTHSMLCGSRGINVVK